MMLGHARRGFGKKKWPLGRSFANLKHGQARAWNLSSFSDWGNGGGDAAWAARPDDISKGIGFPRLRLLTKVRATRFAEFGEL